MIEWLEDASRLSPWPDLNAVVTGLGPRGYSAADLLIHMGAHVIVIDDTDSHADQVKLLEFLGADVRRGTDGLPGYDLVVAPDEGPESPVLGEAERRGVPVWSDVELAWRLKESDVPWLGVTGVRSVDDTIRLVEAIVATAGLTISGAGAGLRPIPETILDEVSYDVLVVGMSHTDLARSTSLRFHSAAVLTLDPDDGHEDEYARIYYQVTNSCVYNAEEPRTEKMVEDADVVEGARAIGFTTRIPAISMVGVVDELIVDRAFIPQRRDSALELARVADIPDGLNPQDVLAAAALARSFGVPATAVRDGLKAYRSNPHSEGEI